MKYMDFFNEYGDGNFSAPQPDFDKYDAVSNPKADPHKTLTGRFADPSIGLNEKAPCWDGYTQYGMKDKNGKQVPNCIPIEEAEKMDTVDDFCTACLREYILEHANSLTEAEYHGRNVPLGKPMRGDVKKFKVYVKDPSTGNIKKVNFGDKTMRIKKNIPGHRKSFRARHHCDTNPGPRTKARYWSCRKW
jgi:hypothetical protein